MSIRYSAPAEGFLPRAKPVIITVPSAQGDSGIIDSGTQQRFPPLHLWMCWVHQHPTSAPVSRISRGNYLTELTEFDAACRGSELADPEGCLQKLVKESTVAVELY